MNRKPLLLIYFVLVLGLIPASRCMADLVGWWRLDETSGTTAYDSSPSGNDGTLTGNPQWVAGRVLGALQLDGDDWVNCGNGAELAITNTITVTCWVNPTGFVGRQGFAGRDGGYTFKVHEAGRLCFTTPGILDHESAATILTAGTWQHVAATFQASQANGLIFYLNAVETDRLNASAMNAGGGPFRIGANQFAGENLTGMIDDVRVYNNILSESEIEEIMLGDDIWKARNPDPAHLAVDVPIDANLSWTRGDGVVQEEVYFGTDPCALPKVADILVLPPFPPLYAPPGDLVASTTYYWQVVEVNGIDRFPSRIWEFTTVRGEALIDYPYDGAVITGDILPYNGEDYIWTKLTFLPGATATKHTGYFSEDYSKVESRAEDANLGEPPYPTVPGWEYAFFAGNPQVSPGAESLVRGTRYYWTVDAEDAKGNVFGGDIWEFAIQGFHAFAPNPPNEAIFISTTPFLTWLPGFGVQDHEIYMGTSWEDVNNAVYDYTNIPPEFVTARSEPNYQVVTALPHNTKIY
ncbi:MAG: LamG domain-containing protein, partial [Planctomycetota bacterium]